MATTAFQTIYPILTRERAKKAEADGRPLLDEGERPVLLNMCHIFSSDGEVARRNWPDHDTGDDSTSDAAVIVPKPIYKKT